MAKTYERARQDVGNIVLLEHVNVTIPDQRLATVFYVSGLGLTRDPYLMTGVENMWVNAGRTQFHLPTGSPQVLRGHVGLVFPDLGQLQARLERVAPLLAESRFGWNGHDGVIAVTCPWGNEYRCHGPDPRFGAVELGIAYVTFDVAPGSAPGIARCYAGLLGARVRLEHDDVPTAVVAAGASQTLRFREKAGPLPAYDGHHIQVYIADFSGPHARLAERGLVTEESDEYQYRFRDLVDPSTGDLLYSIEHEVRSLTHPLYGRPLVNRNPGQTNRAYVRGHDAFRGTC